MDCGTKEVIGAIMLEYSLQLLQGLWRRTGGEDIHGRDDPPAAAVQVDLPAELRVNNILFIHT